ncbi:MAG TPA: hypothetical protein VJ698_15755 [Noviherbaspirillum sp.]|uniref:hypothetical protein n=1 Tax=Noviherbaspirillum sp. TaxID=1926288 RepID=UPI002B463448|nr:hypothetical protein [Noviherbaspirillum sp.]HJV86921.1 hypothetical protein [Noviherbaspirillum sp.]
MSDWADGVFSSGQQAASAGGSAVMSKLFGAASAANPYMAAASALGAAAGSTATSGSTGNKFESSFGNTGWNVSFGSGSISSSADARQNAALDGLSQWVGIASGIIGLLVVLKIIKG